MTLKNPEWGNSEDMRLYDELQLRYRNDEKITNDEKNFLTKMYNLEEYASGLGGDEWTE